MNSESLVQLNIIKRVLISVLVVLFAVSLYCDIRDQKKLALNRLRDQLSFTDLLSLSSGDYAIEQGRLKKYLKYFNIIIKNEPARADAHAMAGFCYYYLGQWDQAVEQYQKAAQLQSGIFWFHYNLGVIFYKQGHHEKALEQFRLAMVTRPSDNIDFVRNSKILVYIIYQANLMNTLLGDQLKDSYGLSAYFIAQYLEQSGDINQAKIFRKQVLDSGIIIPQNGEDLQLRIF